MYGWWLGVRIDDEESKDSDQRAVLPVKDTLLATAIVKKGAGAIIVVANWHTEDHRGRGRDGAQCKATKDIVYPARLRGGSSGGRDESWDIAVHWDRLGLDPETAMVTAPVIPIIQEKPPKVSISLT